MSKCRICLGDEMNLHSVYDTDQGVSFASMIESLSNVKILEGNYDMICITCCNKLKDYYDFRLLIERSNLKLYRHLKIIKFNNRDEINFLIEVDKKPTNFELDFNNIFQKGMKFIHYNNTLIKRMCKEENNEACLAENYLESNLVQNDHMEYPELEDSMFKKCNYEKKNNLLHKVKSKEPEEKKICIKPIFMKDLRVLKSNSTKFLRVKKYNRREDICPYCGKKSKCINKHILQHTAEKKISCNECNRSFYTKQMLISHIKSHLTEPSQLSFKCDHCIVTFSTKVALIRHMAVHTDAKEFTCKICQKAFKWKSGLLRHMLIHSFDKKFKCEICNMSFATKYAFRHHYRVHTRERPYRCELCSQPYSYKRDFNRHCLKKHQVFFGYRSINIMNEEVLKREKALMRDLMLRMQGMKTDREPLDHFQGPQGALAFAKAVKIMQSNDLPNDVHI